MYPQPERWLCVLSVRPVVGLRWGVTDSRGEGWWTCHRHCQRARPATVIDGTNRQVFTSLVTLFFFLPFVLLFSCHTG
jgi:hypothetical protein